jgi:hypothetical protein
MAWYPEEETWVTFDEIAFPTEKLVTVALHCAFRGYEIFYFYSIFAPSFTANTHNQEHRSV